MCPVPVQASQTSINNAGFILFIGDSLLTMATTEALYSGFANQIANGKKLEGSDQASNCSIQKQLMNMGYKIGKNAVMVIQ